MVTYTKRKKRRPTRRRNPVITSDLDDFDYHEPINLGPVGLPKDPLQSFELGRMVGLRRGIDLCGITNIFKRMKLDKKLKKEIEGWITGLTYQAEAVSRGIIGARLPTVAQSEGVARVGKKK